MENFYSDIKKQFQIPETHTLKKGKYKEKDRATFSVEQTEILEYDENNNLVGRYLQEEYADGNGTKTVYSRIDD